MRVVIAPAAILLIATLLLVGCGSAEETDPVKLVPVGSNLIAQVQVAEILKDVDFAALYEAAPKEDEEPQTFDELLSLAFEESGIDFREFSDAVLFGDISRDEDYFAIIARGRFEEDQLLEAIERIGETPLTATEYKGRRIHSDQVDEDGLSLSVLGSDVLVLGAVDAVRAVIDVQEGDRDRASGKVYDTFIAMGDVLVRLTLEVPPELSQELEQASEIIPELGGGLGELPISLEAFKDLDAIGLVLDKDGETIKVEAQLSFTSEDSAADAGNVIDGLLKLARGLSPDEETKSLLDRVQVEATGTNLTILFEASVSDLEELVPDLGEGLDLP